MTKPGKCDACRSRKVKCDEIRPTCGVCRKGGRHCTYTYGKAARFVNVKRPRTSGARSDGSSSPGDSDTPMDTPTSNPEEPALVLSLRSTRGAKVGEGVFQTFVPLCPDKRPAPRSSSKSCSRKRSRSPVDTQVAEPCEITSCKTGMPTLGAYPFGKGDKTLSRWASLIGSGGPDDTSLCPMYTFGDWISLVAPLIGKSEAVHAATACLVDSTIAYVNRDARTYDVARESNATALRKIRMTIQNSDPSETRKDILIAVKLLFTVEMFMGVHTLNYRQHGRGLVDLLQRMTSRGRKCDEISQQIFYASFINDATRAILGGRNSFFDEPAWLDVAPPKTESIACPKSDVAWRYIMRTFVRVPRLIRLVRAAREAPCDAMARLKAQELASELFENDLEHWIREILARGALRLVPTARPDLEPYGAECFHFSSPRLFVILTAYWNTRILLCGCVQALCDLAPLSGVPQIFDQAAARAEDVRAATSIAMCVQYASKTSPILPVVPLRLQMPLIMSFGAWHRLDTRCLMLQMMGDDSPATAAEGSHAQVMKEWCVSMCCDISTKWNGALTSIADLEERSESFAGGPLFSYSSLNSGLGGGSTTGSTYGSPPGGGSP